MWFEKLTFGQLVDQAAERYPQREALCFEGQRWSFAEFRAEVDRVAKGLIAAAPALRRVILLGEQKVPGTLAWDALLRSGQALTDSEVERRCAATDPNGTVLIMYTSGTTGFPKGVMLGHNVLRNIMDFGNR